MHAGVLHHSLQDHPLPYEMYKISSLCLVDFHIAVVLFQTLYYTVLINKISHTRSSHISVAYDFVLSASKAVFFSSPLKQVHIFMSGIWTHQSFSIKTGSLSSL